jgi:hypothetical protein
LSWEVPPQEEIELCDESVHLLPREDNVDWKGRIEDSVHLPLSEGSEAMMSDADRPRG